MQPKKILVLVATILCWMASPLCADAQPQSDGYVHDVIQLEEIPIEVYSPRVSHEGKTFTKVVSSILYNAEINCSVQDDVWKKNYIKLGVQNSETLHGFVTTSSTGIARQVTITWSPNTSNQSKYHDAGIEIYGKNTPYTSVSEAYNPNTRGEKIGFLETDRDQTHMVGLSSPYKYIAIVQVKNFAAITSLDIAWQTEYERTVTAGNLNTLCLPYNVSIPAGMQVYEIYGKTMNNGTPVDIVFTPVDEIVAGKPYVFTNNSEKLSLEIGSEYASTAGNHNGLYGTFENYPFANDANHSDQYYIINSSNEIQAASRKSGVNANRAFIKMNEVPDITNLQSLPSRRLVVTGNGFSIIDETNSIDHLTTTNKPGKKGIVDLAGRTWTNSSTLQKGIYLSNGKKFIK